MIRNTCEGCTERSPACHDRCEKYRQARTEHIQQQIWLKQPQLSAPRLPLRSWWVVLRKAGMIWTLNTICLPAIWIVPPMQAAAMTSR